MHTKGSSAALPMGCWASDNSVLVPQQQGIGDGCPLQGGTEPAMTVSWRLSCREGTPRTRHGLAQRRGAERAGGVLLRPVTCRRASGRGSAALLREGTGIYPDQTLNPRAPRTGHGSHSGARHSGQAASCCGLATISLCCYEAAIQTLKQILSPRAPRTGHGLAQRRAAERAGGVLLRLGDQALAAGAAGGVAAGERCPVRARANPNKTLTSLRCPGRARAYILSRLQMRRAPGTGSYSGARQSGQAASCCGLATGRS